jgi:hypothetical protein
MIRRIAAVLAASAMLLVLAVPVLAGGWADIVADAQTGKPPVEGQPTEVGFTVLQHGVTPAPWESATVHFTDSGTGESFDVTATNDRDDGHFIATATLPHAGYWSWQVTLRDLLSQQVPVRMTVLTRTGATPPFDPATLMAAVDQAKVDMTETLNAGVGADVQRLEANADGQRATISRLESATRQLAAQRDALAERVDALEGGGTGLPLLAVVSLSVLAGAAAGFVMAWLAGRPPRPASGVALSSAPRGADPV